MTDYINNYVSNYVNKWYGNFINKYIYVKYPNDDFLLCKFISHESLIRINNNEIRALLLRKPRSIDVKLVNNNIVTLYNNNYNMVLSKDLLDLYDKIIELNSIPSDIKRVINEYIPEYGKLF